MITYYLLVTCFMLLADRGIRGQVTYSEDDLSANSYELLYKILLLEEENSQQNQRIQMLETAVNLLQLQFSMYKNNTADSTTKRPITSECPVPALATSVPAECCDLPFTINGQLFFNCQTYPTGTLGCYVQGRKWVTCQDQTNFVAQNRTISLTIPNFIQQSVISVNDWIVFQQRIDVTASFNRSWQDYKNGFGIYNTNFWIGLEKIYQLTNSGRYRLRMEMMMNNGTWQSAEYDTFDVGAESTNYRINVTGYSGDSGDAFNYTAARAYNGMPFTTYDRDNDRNYFNLASVFGGGWWFQGDCCEFFLNGYPGATQAAFVTLSTTRMMMKHI